MWTLTRGGCMLWVLLGLGLVRCEVSCKDEDGNKVGWWILYKAPRIRTLTGLEYIYMTRRELRFGRKPINDITGVLANSLWPLLTLDGENRFSFLSYNDQPPRGTKPSCEFGHSKGVVLGDSSDGSALWLTHSTPEFPFRRDAKQFYPNNHRGVWNAQTFMCVSLPFSQLSTVGKHLQNIKAYTFDKKNTDSFPKDLKDAASNPSRKVSLSSSENILTLSTWGKQKFKLMAKRTGPTAEVGDLYVQLATGIRGAVYAKTWGCQFQKEQSYCDGPPHTHVTNADMVKTSLGSWTWGRDHSKWAVTASEDLHWTCITDMNRSPSQYKRRGGAVCIKDKTVHSYFIGFVANTPRCDKPPTEEQCRGPESEQCKDKVLSSVIKRLMRFTF